jgi:hypothetical protein
MNDLIFVQDEIKTKKVKAAIAILEEILQSDLLTISAKERQRQVKLGDASRAFVSKSAEYSLAHPELLPGYIDKNALAEQIKSLDLLRSYQQSLQKLSNSVNDTLAASNNQAMKVALTFYKSVGVALGNNAPNAKAIYDDLSIRFKYTLKPKGNQDQVK